ncbi:sensor histidine kinase [Microbacterium kyungheense]|uniref:histidine kinase n=1 Tax=Microbacterium kyungheense TaxID=1263636 RepID=A0A543F2B2_9MICO|nr:sensor histidine kinase [Microbacterium kyungheense]TQM27977.1 signal transduction histidine kinase [Microbacterium kyungheense]
MTSALSAMWDAPPALPRPPRRTWRDWALVGILPPLTFAEAALRTDVPSRWVWAVVLTALIPTLLWRRERPFTMLAIAFGTGTIAGLIVGGDPQLIASAWFLILVYAVFRWGSGRSALGGVLLVAGGTLLSFLADRPQAGDLVGGIAVVVATASLGLALRWRSRAHSRELERARLLERERFARDLHDTVAHHVSAIAVQAQAGAILAADDPAATVTVLHRIDREASRTLDELRSMVRLLREPGAGAVAPAAGLDDLRALAGTRSTAGSSRGLQVRVDVDADADSLPSAVAMSVFRIAQEATTNAVRHARDATAVEVRLRVDGEGARLDIRDDGHAAASVGPGFGLTGMAERAALLGGTLAAGPAADGGWLVTAHLPRAGWAS